MPRGVPNKTPTPTPTPTPSKTPGKIEVETTGSFSLYDPISRQDIPHEGSVEVDEGNSFINTMLKRKRLKKV